LHSQLRRQRQMCIRDRTNTTGEIRIRKMDKDSNDLIPGTTFEGVFTGDNASGKKTVKTGTNGEVTIKDLPHGVKYKICLLYTSDAADEVGCVDL
ncbi:prealbumin-like fold domain-containing protein, partial [Enterococcus sp. S181_ASV_20]|nr:prealbumin-like fold domain-containing protein [Enterococcus sp. S181_ASV_20]